MEEWAKNNLLNHVQKMFCIHKMKLDFQNINWEFKRFVHYCKETYRKKQTQGQKKVFSNFSCNIVSSDFSKKLECKLSLIFLSSRTIHIFIEIFVFNWIKRLALLYSQPRGLFQVFNSAFTTPLRIEFY